MKRRTLSRCLLAAIAALPLAALIAQLALDTPWWSRDQQAARLYGREAYADAAARFADPAWRATALYADGRFDDAATLWSGIPGSDAAYNRGNALVFRGLYQDAVTSYERALDLRPGWPEAEQNRLIALSRIRTETALGEASEIGADDVVFDPDMNDTGGDEIEVTSGGALSDDALRELWLRNVQTRPADFLRVKFAYQRAVQARGEGEQVDR